MLWWLVLQVCDSLSHSFLKSKDVFLDPECFRNTWTFLNRWQIKVIEKWKNSKDIILKMMVTQCKYVSGSSFNIYEENFDLFSNSREGWSATFYPSYSVKRKKLNLILLLFYWIHLYIFVNLSIFFLFVTKFNFEHFYWFYILFHF